MKKFTVLLTSLVFLFTSCMFSWLGEEKHSGVESANYSIQIDKLFASNVRSAISQRIGSDTPLTVVITFSGEYNTSQSKNLTLNSLAGTNFYFDNVPLGKTFDIYVGIYYNNGTELLYEASQSGVVLTTAETMQLSLILKKLLNTQYVLYKYDEEKGYQYYLKDSADASVSGDGDFTSDASDTTPNNFCFDSDGNFYVLKASSDDSQFKVCSDKTGFTDVIISDSLDNAPCITVDLATNILYASSNNGVSWTMYKYPNLVSSGKADYETYFYYPSDSEWLFNASEPFVVYDGIVYAVCSKYNSETSSNEYKLAVFDSKKSSRSATSDDGYTQYTIETQSNDIVDIGWSNFADSSSAKITDILYQDGAVYMLVRDYYTSELLFGVNTSEPSKFYSRGAVLKYDVSTKTVKTLGWTSSAVYTSTASLYGYITDSSQNVCYVYYYESMSLPFKITKDMEGLNENIKSKLFPVIYAPKTTDKGFYGPQKFIAIKPKKLIIADDGLAFYTDDNGLWNYKNANRIVSVDLESFAITSIQKGTVSFDEDFTESMITGDVSYPAIASSYFTGTDKKYTAYAKETDSDNPSEITRDVYAAMKLSE